MRLVVMMYLSMRPMGRAFGLVVYLSQVIFVSDTIVVNQRKRKDTARAGNINFP